MWERPRGLPAYGLKLKGDFPPPLPGAIPIIPVTGGGLEQSCQTNGNFWALIQGRTHRIVERARYRVRFGKSFCSDQKSNARGRSIRTYGLRISCSIHKFGI